MNEKKVSVYGCGSARVGVGKPPSVAVCCSALQCVAVCCGVMQCDAVCCSVFPHVAVCCRVLQSVAVHLSCENLSLSLSAYLCGCVGE